MTFIIKKIDHIQLAAPQGSEEKARNFYTDLLGFQEIEKPTPLKKRGGVWFAVGNQQVHIGIAEPFVPAKKAHPAFEVDNLERLKHHLSARGITLQEDENLSGAKRFYIFDPRLEFLEWNTHHQPLENTL